eukprot:CAMPEP_0173414486 /NCGR_PEP_ID=MMETSP1356-20130122/84348_1 /TAXON_ID=77927 ORGANISM="Hemiselmis virescens, Strain PCC157" /NCGR_SAMPLE_ID=MMETSP1356 /ASSEMBLY_ACC=CAM_ASM_000847 /LENGTH=514 /DNA_ID=CAMNT_0014376669 /DNA_START=247 /DNA_END=1791 /DNA_ORIENTATION=+
MARALLDACAAHVFQKEWAAKIPDTVRGEGRTWLSRKPHGVMLRDLEEFVFAVLRELHPDGESIHGGFTFGHILALCYPPRSPGQVHHFDLIGGGAYVLTLGLVPEGRGDGQEGTCVLELDEADRQLLLGCGEQAFHTFMLAWGSHMQANASNAFGALEDFCSNKGKAHVGLLRAWTGWLLSDGPLGVPLVDEADKRFKPLSGHVDAGVGMMIPNVWHKGGSNDTDRWRVVAFLFVGSEMAGQYSFSEQWNSIVVLAWAYGELSPVVVSQAVQWELCMGVRVCASLAQPEDGGKGEAARVSAGVVPAAVHLSGDAAAGVQSQGALSTLQHGPEERGACDEGAREAGASRRGRWGFRDPQAERYGRGWQQCAVYDEDSGLWEHDGEAEVWGVDGVVRMFMRVAVCCKDAVSEQVVAALWEDVRQFLADGSSPGSRVSALLLRGSEGGGEGRKRKVLDVELGGVEQTAATRETLAKVGSLIKDIRQQRALQQKDLGGERPCARFEEEMRGIQEGCF